jgi:alpha-glucuronidase
MDNAMKRLVVFFLVALFAVQLFAEDGHNLWLRPKPAGTVEVNTDRTSATIKLAVDELKQGWQGSPDARITLTVKPDEALRCDGYKLGPSSIQANTELGVLYGVFDLLRRQKTGEPTTAVISNPSYQHRILNHWDNLDGSIERGYAGRSIFWKFGKDAMTVTDQDRTLWREYARANASIGINGAVLDNVNASPQILSNAIVQRVAAIADEFRPYGIRTYLSINFSAPKALGGLKTSDPLDPTVIAWWQARAKEIYRLVPDFGGFLVKANSEGLPGPQDFGRTHADGANMLADVLKPYGGLVMWRAFVYNPTDQDRAKQAYSEFMPLDGQFRDNVIIQVKNGPVDFQPREPFSPLFGAMKKTSVMPELQITQEYLGQSIQLVYLAPMWEECLTSDTYQSGKGSTVARCTDGSLYPQKQTAIAGVANIGLDRNWCGHLFAQSNWYAFGRLAWNNSLTSKQLAFEWLRQTFPSERQGWDEQFLKPVGEMMLQSREAAVNYMMPLGLHHQFAGSHHYGPGPWYAPKGMRADWSPVYYHKADTFGIGFDRTKSGSNAVSQYHEPLCSLLNDRKTCPEEYLLWFHRVPWTHTMKNGRTLWDELCYRYDDGVRQVRRFQTVWDKVQPFVDAPRFADVQRKLRIHARDAQIWKDGCLLYFQQFSRMPIPFDIERPVNNLDEVMSLDLKTNLNP